MGTIRRHLSPAVRNVFARLGWLPQRISHEADIRSTLGLIRPFKITTPLKRYGGEGDGGYLLPETLENVTAVFSPGVAQTSLFEAYFADLGIPCFMIDPNVDNPPIRHSNFIFERMALGPTSIPGSQIALEDWVTKYAQEGNLVLQMDIEGAEYESILAAPRNILSRFGYIALELHDFTALASRSGGRLIRATIQKLLESHLPIHVHPNNCCRPLRTKRILLPNVIEVSFARRDLVLAAGEYAVLPHPLDAPNVQKRDWQIEW